MRRVNRSWRENVAKSLEWAALEVVRIDTPGLIRYLEDRQECHPSLRERVEAELLSISVLLSEDLMDFVPQSRNIRAGADEFLETWWPVEDASRLIWGAMRTSNPWSANEYVDSEIEESEESCVDEAWNSSSEDSLRVYFPRHSLRV